MRVATFNINGINRRLPILLECLARVRPDVIGLQEIKCHDRDFPDEALRAAGYASLRHGQGRHHGVALLVRDGQAIETRRGLPGDDADLEARYLEAAVAGILIGCIYVPNGNPQPGPRFAYKLHWLERLHAHARDLQAAGIPAILLGDYNVVPTDDDIYATRSWHSNALLQPEPRAAYAHLLDSGWTDVIRSFGENRHAYTFWDYERHAWERDAGMRIDHILTSAALTARVRRAGIERDLRGLAGASDHAPVWADLT